MCKILKLCAEKQIFVPVFSSKFSDLVTAFYHSMTEVLEFGQLLVKDRLSCSKIFLSCWLFVSITKYHRKGMLQYSP